MADDILNPQDRHKLLEHLRPPEGFTLDRAIGTTYSLDLVSLLIAPLAMVMFECEDKDDLLKDPTALLEALQQTRGRLTLFCQSGRISVPRTSSCLLNLLEPIVVEVEPENERGVFHPKIWLLRFVGPGKAIQYRLICLSRNMTFDKCWDTMLVLDGEYDKDRVKGFSANRPLSDFISALPGVAKRKSPDAAKHARLMADEVLRVRFVPPEPFDDIRFWPMGVEGYTESPDFDAERLLIASPFLSEESLEPLARSGRKNILISRIESLDALDPLFLNKIERRGKIYVMNQSAETPEGPSEAEGTGSSEDSPSGLHAKLFVAENGWDAHLFTGSANATRNALKGVNVEFLVELIGKKSRVGVDSVTGQESKEATLMSLLVPYEIRKEKKEANKEQVKLEKLLESARGIICRAAWKVNISAEDSNQYRQTLAGAPGLKLEKGIQFSCWPALLPTSHERSVDLAVPDQRAVFPGLSLVALGGFMAFRVKAEVGKSKGELSFVLNLPVEGMPEDRDRRILQHIVSDTANFIRCLLLMLSRNPEEMLLGRDPQEPPKGGEGGGGDGNLIVPLFEEMLRAVSRDPARIRRIARLVDELKLTEEGRKIIPEGFDRVWTGLRAALPAEDAA